MSISLGNLCAHVLGREAICIDMTFLPAKPLVAGLALLCCLYFYQKRKTRHVHFGDVQYQSQPLKRRIIDKRRRTQVRRPGKQRAPGSPGAWNRGPHRYVKRR